VRTPSGGFCGAFYRTTERFVGRRNIEHFRATLQITPDPGQRQMLEELLLDAEAKLKKAEQDPNKR